MDQHSHPSWSFLKGRNLVVFLGFSLWAGASSAVDAMAQSENGSRSGVEVDGKHWYQD